MTVSKQQFSKSKKSDDIPVVLSTKPSFAVMKNLMTSPNQGKFIIFDIETTGGNPRRNGITEIAGLKLYKGMVVDRFYSLVNPQMRIPPIVKKITGIKNEMLYDAPIIDDVIPQFVDFIEDGVLVSHNAIADIQYLQFYSKKVTKKYLDNFFLCTQKLAERIFVASKSKSLKGLYEYLGMPEQNFHRADKDADATKLLFMRLLESERIQKLSSIEELVRFQEDLNSSLRLGWKLSRTDIIRLPKKTGVLILKNYKQKKVFVKSSDNMREDLQQLSQLTRLPKSIQKIVIKAASVEHLECPSILSAMISEHQLTKKLGFVPDTDHRKVRAIQALCFNKHEEIIKVSCDITDESTLFAFGPVHDHQKLISIFADIFNKDTNNKKSHFIINKKEFELFLRIINPNKSTWERILGLLNFKFFRLKSKLDKPIKDLNLIPLLDFDGIAVEKLKDDTMWRSYLVQKSKITAELISAVDPRSQLDTTKAKLEKNLLEYPVEANCFLWWYFRFRKHHQNECFFISC